jgi:hypothetical protein
VTAVLHDTVEDTETTPAELEARFGADVRAVVEEVTDDKTLPKEERKRLRIDPVTGQSGVPAEGLVGLREGATRTSWESPSSG